MQSKIRYNNRQVFNFYEELRGGLSFNKFEVEGLLFVEYNCPLENEKVRIWSKNDYIVYVLSGVKRWETNQGCWTLEKGEALYIQKGANIIKQFLDEDFCMLGFFISDEIIRSTIKDISDKMALPKRISKADQTIVKLTNIPNLDGFYQSMLSYFRYSESPVSSILELKAKELLLHIIGSGEHPELAAYFYALSQDTPSLQRVMESNFNYNLSLSEYADLCNRSLSSFKRDFKSHYNTSPGQWLSERRLKHAAALLLSKDLSVSEIAFESGFEDASHFSRVFKEKYASSPTDYKKKHQK